MKRKMIYVAILVFCLSFYSSANENASKCAARCTCKKTNIEKFDEPLKADQARQDGFDLSPLNTFVFNS